MNAGQSLMFCLSVGVNNGCATMERDSKNDGTFNKIDSERTELLVYHHGKKYFLSLMAAMAPEKSAVGDGDFIIL